MKRVLSGVASCLCLCACATTMPLPHETDVPRIVVNYADLNLQHRSGVKLLYTRLRRMADKVCTSDEVNPRDLAKARLYQRCRAEALDRAVTDIQNALLTQYASERKRMRLAQN